LKSEIDNYQKQLAESSAALDRSSKAASNLQKELGDIRGTKADLAKENDTLRHAIDELQDKLKAAEQRITDRYEAELRKKTEALSKETEKITGLESLIENLTNDNRQFKRQCGQLKEQMTKLQEKYQSQAGEYSSTFTVSLKHVDLIASLTTVTASQRAHQEDHGSDDRPPTQPERDRRVQEASWPA
jgi:chromosome segregation ATPase